MILNKTHFSLDTWVWSGRQHLEERVEPTLSGGTPTLDKFLHSVSHSLLVELLVSAKEFHKPLLVRLLPFKLPKNR